MCTGITFTDINGENLYFGRNLDWSYSYGEQIVITPINYQPQSPFNAIKKIKYPVIGMGIVVENTPLYFDCANNEGLAIAGLNFTNYTQYELEPIYTTPIINITAYEFPLWVAATFKSVEELKQQLQYVAIINKSINDKFPTSYLHWIISDKKQCIVIEYNNNKIHIFDNPFDVLTNQPNFDWQIENLKNYLNVTPQVPTPIEELKVYGSGGGMRGLPGDYYSPSRFVRAAYLNYYYPLKNTEKENITRLFKILGGVSMIEGAACMLDNTFEKTIYTSGFSSKTNTYYYSTYDNPAIQSYPLKNYNINNTELIIIIPPK